MGINHETLRRAKQGLVAKYDETDGRVDRQMMGDRQTGRDNINI